MKDKLITVYSGRGMVVGCAGAGKTTLVKKLKGEKNLDTNSTSGIEIHPHVFKLDLNKNTIIRKYISTLHLFEYNSINLFSTIKLFINRSLKFFKIFNWNFIKFID